MKATLILTDQLANKVIKETPYDIEESAQEDFNTITKDWSEWDDKVYRLDLIAHHPIHGDLCRRSMFNNFLD